MYIFCLIRKTFCFDCLIRELICCPPSIYNIQIILPNQEFLCENYFRYQEKLRVHALRVMAVVEKTMHRLDCEEKAAKVIQMLN